ncbi:MAG: methyltransferase [Flavobacteriales bacterium]|nr:methyltransferase [Flavobacteriales bacterium]
MFRFKRFTIQQDRCAMKVGTDGVVLGAWAEMEGAKRILDIGTGTGLLALMAAQRNAIAWIDAVEIDGPAAKQAAENVAASAWKDRIRVHRMDVRRVHITEPYDLIICNPPYYSGMMDSADARTSLAKHGAELTFNELIFSVDRMLGPQGTFALIIPIDREQAMLRIAEQHGLRPARRCAMSYLAARQGKRVLLEVSRNAGASAGSALVVEHHPGLYTEAFRDLLAPFMLDF